MNNTLKGYATETWVLKRLSKFKATSSSTSGAQIVGSTHEHANKETLDKLTEEMIKVLSTLSIDENGHLCSSVGLYSQSFVSAFGLNPSSGGSGGGGAASIIVNGNQYTPNADGVVTLPDYPTSLTWSNIQGKPSWIGSTKPTYTASEVGALASNHPASDVTSALITNWNTAYGWGNHANAGYLKSVTSSMIVSALGYTPFNNASFTRANIKSTLGISDWALAASKPTYTLDEVADGTTRRLADYLPKSVFDDLFEKVTEGGVTYIKAKYGIASVGFMSAFGTNSGGGSTGGAGSIVVNGQQYNPNADGVITLPNYPTSLNWADITGKPSWIGASKPTYTASEVGALASNHPASDVTSARIANWNTAYGWGNHASAGYLKKSEIGSQSVNYATSAGNAATATKWATARKITLTGSVTGSVSIDGSGDVTLATTTNHTHTFASLTSKPTTISGYGITDALKALGNSDSYSTDLNNIRTNGSVYVSIEASNKPAAYCEMLCMYNVDTLAQVAISFSTGGYMYYRGGNIANGYYDWRTVLDSSNYNSYAPTLTGTGASGTWNISISGNADTLDGYHHSSFAKIGSPNNLIHNGNEVTFVPSAYTGRMWFNYRTTGGTNGAISEYYFGNGAGGSLAIISAGQFSGNSATATKLQTSRTLWGQTFDGSASVSGNMTGVGSITPTTDNSYDIGTSSTQFKLVYANGIYAKSGSWFGIGANNTDHIRITTDGNVGIGTTSPKTKLHVIGGQIKCNYPIFGDRYSTNNNAAAFIWDKPGSNYTGVGSDGTADTIRFSACTDDGTWVSYAQNWKFYGNIIATANITAYSDRKLKTNISKLEYRGRLNPVTYTWRDGNDEQHIGFIAQEVKELYPELVQDNSGLLSLNYQCCTAVLSAQLNMVDDEVVQLKKRVAELEEETENLKMEKI